MQLEKGSTGIMPALVGILPTRNVRLQVIAQ